MDVSLTWRVMGLNLPQVKQSGHRGGVRGGWRFFIIISSGGLFVYTFGKRKHLDDSGTLVQLGRIFKCTRSTNPLTPPVDLVGQSPEVARVTCGHEQARSHARGGEELKHLSEGGEECEGGREEKTTR